MITLKVSKSRLTIGDVVDAENGIKTTARMVEFLTKFVVGDDGEYLPADQARARILELSLDDLPGIADQLAEGVKSITTSAVPLPTSTS
jgi:hypothetical protein